ncbi:MAG: hypothetical protein ACXVFN_01005 [Solirubrobacteraceae bacterium]
MAVVLGAFVPASASAAGGVLLSGYAPPAAGDQAILGLPAHASAPTHATSSQPTAAARSALPLAQAAPAATAGSSRARHRSRGTGSRHTVAGVRRHTTPPAIVAAARGSAGSIFSWWQAALVAALATVMLGLARGWRRGDG